ncbi:hypothetical protein D3C85_1450290 [compost metagenome]
MDPDTPAAPRDAVEGAGVDLAAEHPLPEVLVLPMLLGGKQQQVGLADQRLRLIVEDGAEQRVDRDDAASEVELDDAIGTIEGGQSGQGVVTTESVNVEGAEHWGIHGHDSFRIARS